MHGHPVWFEIHVATLSRAENFYHSLAGWEFTSLEGMPVESYRMIATTPSGAIGGAIVTGFPDRRGSGTVIYIEVENLERSVAMVEAHGGTVEATEQAINNTAGSFVLVRDPDGNLLGLWAS